MSNTLFIMNQKQILLFYLMVDFVIQWSYFVHKGQLYKEFQISLFFSSIENSIKKNHHTEITYTYFLMVLNFPKVLFRNVISAVVLKDFH